MIQQRDSSSNGNGHPTTPNPVGNQPTLNSTNGVLSSSAVAMGNKTKIHDYFLPRSISPSPSVILPAIKPASLASTLSHPMTQPPTLRNHDELLARTHRLDPRRETQLPPILTADVDRRMSQSIAPSLNKSRISDLLSPSPPRSTRRRGPGKNNQVRNVPPNPVMPPKTAAKIRNRLTPIAMFLLPPVKSHDEDSSPENSTSAKDEVKPPVAPTRSVSSDSLGTQLTDNVPHVPEPVVEKPKATTKEKANTDKRKKTTVTRAKRTSRKNRGITLLITQEEIDGTANTNTQNSVSSPVVEAPKIDAAAVETGGKLNEPMSDSDEAEGNDIVFLPNSFDTGFKRSRDSIDTNSSMSIANISPVTNNNTQLALPHLPLAIQSPQIMGSELVPMAHPPPHHHHQHHPNHPHHQHHLHHAPPPPPSLHHHQHPHHPHHPQMMGYNNMGSPQMNHLALTFIDPRMPPSHFNSPVPAFVNPNNYSLVATPPRDMTPKTPVRSSIESLITNSSRKRRLKSLTDGRLGSATPLKRTKVNEEVGAMALCKLSKDAFDQKARKLYDRVRFEQDVDVGFEPTALKYDDNNESKVHEELDEMNPVKIGVKVRKNLTMVGKYKDVNSYYVYRSLRDRYLEQLELLDELDARDQHEDLVSESEADEDKEEGEEVDNSDVEEKSDKSDAEDVEVADVTAATTADDTSNSIPEDVTGNIFEFESESEDASAIDDEVQGVVEIKKLLQYENDLREKELFEVVLNKASNRYRTNKIVKEFLVDSVKNNNNLTSKVINRLLKFKKFLIDQNDALTNPKSIEIGTRKQSDDIWKMFIDSYKDKDDSSSVSIHSDDIETPHRKSVRLNEYSPMISAEEFSKLVSYKYNMDYEDDNVEVHKNFKNQLKEISALFDLSDVEEVINNDLFNYTNVKYDEGNGHYKKDIVSDHPKSGSNGIKSATALSDEDTDNNNERSEGDSVDSITNVPVVKAPLYPPLPKKGTKGSKILKEIQCGDNFSLDLHEIKRRSNKLQSSKELNDGNSEVMREIYDTMDREREKRMKSRHEQSDISHLHGGDYRATRETFDFDLSYSSGDNNSSGNNNNNNNNNNNSNTANGNGSSSNGQSRSRNGRLAVPKYQAPRGLSGAEINEDLQKMTSVA